ncbi:hypothetical protein GWI33_008806, partial [Rhynchophorus ferrugineus]
TRRRPSIDLREAGSASGGRAAVVCGRREVSEIGKSLDAEIYGRFPGFGEWRWGLGAHRVLLSRGINSRLLPDPNS